MRFGGVVLSEVNARNGKIDLLRMLFSVCILFNHAKYLFRGTETYNRFNFLSLAVEFFFIVSGYLMVASIEKRRNNDCSLYKETAGFLSKKFKSVFVESTVAYVIGLLVVARAMQLSLFSVLVNSWSEIFFINSSGIGGIYVNPAIWYISSMLLSMAIIYPIIRKFGKLASNILLPLAALLILAYLARNYMSIRDPHKWINYSLKGNMRAFAEISLGALCYSFTKKIKSVNLTLFSRMLLTALEGGIYVLFIYYMTTVGNYLNDLFYLALLCIAVSISFAHVGIFDKLLDNKLCYFLGKFSLPIYLSHNFYARNLSILIPSFSSFGFSKKLVIYIGISVLTAVVVMLISMLIRKLVPLLWNKLKPIFVK